MSITAVLGSVEQGLIYSLVALGIVLSYRVLDLADLTVDGSFTLGAAWSAVLATAGHPILGIGAAFLAGGAAGLVTAALQTKLKVQPILAGIITMTALYSINLMVMGGRSNLPLLRVTTIFTMAEEVLPPSVATLVVTGLFSLAAAGGLFLYLRTQLGLTIRATGDNRAMVSSSSINPNFTTTVGLCVANALVATGGALLAQYQSFAEPTMGTGMVVIGLASLIIGEVLVGGHRSILHSLAGAVLGAIVYRLIIAVALRTSISASNLKLVSAIIVAAAISYPAIKERVEFYKLRKAGKQDADTLPHSENL